MNQPSLFDNLPIATTEPPTPVRKKEEDEKTMALLDCIAATYGWKIEEGVLINGKNTKVHKVEIKNGRIRMSNMDGVLRCSIPTSLPEDLGKYLEETFYAKKIETATNPDETDKIFAERVAAALRWQGAHMKAELAYLNAGKKIPLEITRTAGKSHLDDYITRKFSISAGDARDISNHITAKNLAADETASLEEFKDESWAGMALS